MRVPAVNRWLSPADVGRRVSVRRQTPGGLRDSVGILVGWTGAPAGQLQVQIKDGTLVDLPARDVFAARVVPPEVSALALEEIGAVATPPGERERLGDWELRFDGTQIGRTNSVRLVGDPGGDLEDALDYVREWYGRRDARALIQTPVPGALDDQLVAAGWTPHKESVVLTKQLTGPPAIPDPRPSVDVTRAPTPEWLDVAAPDLARGLDRSIARVAHQYFVTNYDDDIPVSVARVALAQPWGVIASVRTLALASRRGHARRLMAAVEATAWSAGSRQLVLQVMTQNAAALSLYADLGYTPHHRYRYFLAP